MRPPKRVLCIMDLSLYGRAGLAAVLPALAAAGAQGVALPAMLLSTHTGGYGPVCRQDAAAFCGDALHHFVGQGLSFEAIYTGYLNGEAQFALAQLARALWPGAWLVADPAMADNGRLYGGMGDDTVELMRALCDGAGLITPNYTESALLLGEAPGLAWPGEDVLQGRLAALSQNGRSVVITSVPTPDGGFETRGCGPEYSDPFTLPSHRQPVQYPGTGDLFAAALAGLLLAGRHGLAAAAAGAARFVEAAARATFEGGGQPRQGLWFEPFLFMLAGGAENNGGREALC